MIPENVEVPLKAAVFYLNEMLLIIIHNVKRRLVVAMLTCRF